MKKALTALAIIVFIFACSGGGGGISNSNTRPPVTSALDLRLGQISSSSSPVAVSAALQNGESVTIYSDGLSDEFEAVYVAPSGDTLQVKHDSAGKPVFAQFLSTTAAYTNYTKENTVDITMQSSDTNRRARSTSINHHIIEADVLEFLNSEQLLQIILDTHQDSDSEIRAFLAAAYAALRVVGCSSSEFAPDEFSLELCGSLLLEKIRKILEQSNYGGITVNLTNQYPTCETPETYEQKSTCAIDIWKDLLKATRQGVVGDYPDNGNSSGGSSGSTNNNGGGSSTGGSKPTPTFTATPTVTFTPTPTDTPTIPSGQSIYIGHWSGGNSSTDGGANCKNGTFAVEIEIVSNGDSSCMNPLCKFDQNISVIQGNNTNFPVIASHLTGTIDSNGFITFGLFPPTNPSIAVFLADGMPSGANTISGTFNATPGNPLCSGTYQIQKL